MQIPSVSASILQTLNMAWAFVENKNNVKMLINSNIDNFYKKVEENYSLSSIFRPKISIIKFNSKGLYSILFFLFILKNWILNNNSVFIARDIGEGYLISILKKYILRNHVFIYEMHDSVYLEHLNSKKSNNLYIKRREWFVLNNCDFIIYTGQHLQNTVHELYAPTTPGFVVPPGYNPQIFPSAASRNNRNGSVVLGYFGSLFPDKGVDVFLETLGALPDVYSGVVVGGNPASRLEHLKRRAEALGLGERIRFCGQVAPASVPSALAGADAIVIPFQTPTEFLSPIKLYEALALGLPIIATPVPALVELSRTVGSLVIARDCTPHGLSECVQSLFSDERRLKEVRGCAEMRHNVCTWKERAEMILLRVFNASR
jgi:glycosyltransferase involved in cell wall biosynthesis